MAVVEKTLAVVSFETSQEVYRVLGALLETGLFGATRGEVVERLLCEKLREIEPWWGKR